MHPNYSLIHETGQNYPSSPSISDQKPGLSKKNPQRITLTIGCIAKTLLWPCEVPFCASKCPFIKEGTMPFEILDIPAGPLKRTWRTVELKLVKNLLAVSLWKFVQCRSGNLWSANSATPPLCFILALTFFWCYAFCDETLQVAWYYFTHSVISKRWQVSLRVEVIASIIDIIETDGDCPQ
jgi:hypothetical protein